MMSGSDRNEPTISRNQRIFGITENALVRTSLQYQGYLKFGEVLHLQGPYIALKTLELAIQCIQRRHPFLRSRLKVNPAQMNSYLMEEDNDFHLPIREIPRNRDDHLNFWYQEWRKREKESPVVGQGLVELWLLQDPDDRDSTDGPREIVIICDHSISDAMSLSTVAHELLIALADSNNCLFEHSLDWPRTIESSVQANLSMWDAFIKVGKLILTTSLWRVSTGRFIARLPSGNTDFPLNDMAKHCHTEIFYGSLNKEETAKLVAKCRHEGVTVTSAVSIANICAAATLVSDRTANLVYFIAADLRRRCQPPVPNHELSFHAAGIMSFSIPINNIPTISNEMWHTAKIIGQHIQTSVDAGQVHAFAKIMGRIHEKNLEGINFALAPTCGISNWGILPFQEQYGQWKMINMVPLGNMIRSPIPMLFVQTVNDILTISIFAAVPLLSSNLLENLQDRTMENIRAMLTD